MSVDSTTRKQSFPMNGTTVAFEFSFIAIRANPEDIKCQVVSTTGTVTLLTYTTDYTVAINAAGEGGIVTVDDAQATGDTLLVYRDTTNVQDSSYNDYNQFPADTVEADFDKRTLKSQEQDDEISRCVKAAISSDISDIELPTPVNGKAMKWSGTGGTLVNTTYNPDEQVDNASSYATISASHATTALGAADIATTQASIATTQATISTAQAVLAASSATVALNAANTIPSPTTGSVGDLIRVATGAETYELFALTSGSIPISLLGSPSYSTIQDFIDTTMSAGYTSGGEITDVDGAHVSVAAGTGFIKVADSTTSSTVSFNWAEDTSVVLTDDVLNYVYVDYNGGVPIIDATVDFTALDEHTQFVIGVVFRKGASAEIVADSGVKISDFRINDWHRLNHKGIERMLGGVVAENGTRGLNITASVYYIGNTEVKIPALTGGTFTLVYRDGAGGWTFTGGTTQLTNSLYDDNSGTPSTIGVSKYGVYWVYQCMAGDNYVQYGQVDSYTLAQAQLAPITIPPSYLANFAYLVAKIIILNGGTNFTEIQNANGDAFMPTLVNNHDELGNLAWGASKHTGTINNFAGFDGAGAETHYPEADYLLASGARSAATITILTRATIALLNAAVATIGTLTVTTSATIALATITNLQASTETVSTLTVKTSATIALLNTTLVTAGTINITTKATIALASVGLQTVGTINVTTTADIALATIGTLTISTKATIALLSGGLATIGTLTITTAATIALLNATSATIGTLLLTGGQLTFPAVQVPSANANCLDDYEEGTWNAELRGSTARATTPVEVTGNYTKIGNKVTASVYFAGKDTTGATGDMRVVGLPFTSLNVATCQYSGSVITYGLNVPGLYNSPIVIHNTTIVSFYSMVNNGNWLAPSITAAATKYMILTVTYFTA